MTKDVADTPIFQPSLTGQVLDPSRPILAHARTLRTGESVRSHQHPRGQLLWAMRGVLRVTSEASVWIVPPSHAVWVPGGTEHQVATETEVLIRNLYVDPTRPLRAKEQGCAVLLLTPLLRELILRLCESDQTAAFPPELMRLTAVIADETEALVPAPLDLPGGHDARLLRATAHLNRHPHEGTTLPEISVLAGASPRTLERLFRQETGLTFRQWRSRLRLLLAIERLNLGQSSSEIALSLGYRTASAFVSAFHQQFGAPPQSFLGRR